MVVFVAALMIMSLTSRAYAEETPVGTGTITVKKNYEDQTYKLYKIFDATTSEGRTSTDTDKISYRLTINNIIIYYNVQLSVSFFVKINKIPELTLEITGRYETTLKLNEITEYVPVYEFDAGIVDIFGTHINKYVGIKYADLIKYLNMPYSTITMFVSDRKKVSYRPSEIDYEKTFIVFSMDDKSINTSKMTLLAVNYNYLYSVENLTSIDYQE